MTSSNPKVTWLLPVLNGGKYLEKALRSIKEQTYSNHEVLAWDNGSTDGSIEILKEWIPHKIKGIAVTDKPFKHLGACLAEMVDQSETELMARMDADDVIDLNRLSIQIDFMNKNPDLIACGTACTRIDIQDKVFDRYAPPITPAAVRFSLFYKSPVIHASLVMKKSKVLEAGNYPRVSAYEDYEFCYKLTEVGKIHNLKLPLYHYRSHPDSVVATEKRNWPKFQKLLLEKYYQQLFPGISLENIKIVWNNVSQYGDSAPRSHHIADLLKEMAYSIKQHPIYENENIFNPSNFYTPYDRCAPKDIRGMLNRLKIATKLYR